MTFRSQNIVVDLVATIGSYTLDDTDGIDGEQALRVKSTVAGAGTQLQIWQDNYSNPVTSIGGLVPDSDTDPLGLNYGTFQGIGTTTFKFPVGFNGQTFPRCSIDVLSDEVVTVEDPKIKVAYAGISGFNTTGAAIVNNTIELNGNVIHTAGANTLTQSTVHIRSAITGAGALPGDVANALWIETGLTRIDTDTTIGLPSARVPFKTYSDAVVFQGSTTTAQAAAAGTMLDLRQGTAHNYLGFSNPDATDAGIVINNVTANGDAYIVYQRSTGGWIFGALNATRAVLTASKFSAPSFGIGTTGPTWTSGAGTPESNVTAVVGSFYSRTDGGAATSFYVKESGSGTTGWVAK